MTHPLQDIFKQLASLQEQAADMQLELFSYRARCMLLREEGRLRSVEMYAYGRSFILDWATRPDEKHVSAAYDDFCNIAVPDDTKLSVYPCTVFYKDVK